MEGGDEWNWVFHYEATTGTTETDLVVLTALRDSLDGACIGLETHLHANMDSTECELFVWDPILNRYDGTSQIGWTTFNGVNVAEPLPNQVAGLVKFFTAVGRRQGRKYIPGLTESGWTGASWSAGLVTAMGVWAAIQDNLVPATGVTMFPGVFNSTVGSALFETFEPFAGVTAVDTVASTQRRRKPSVGI